MRSYKGLFDQVVRPNNIELALMKSLRGKRDKPSATVIDIDHLMKIYELEETLKDGSWRSHPFNEFWSRTEVKLRWIQAPVFEDRIVHHSIINVCGDIFTRPLIATTYACLIGRGNHRAVLKTFEYAGLHDKEEYVLQIDISKFFPSVDRNLLLERLAKQFREEMLLNLFKEILIPEWDTTGKVSGLPIGSVTSQVWANYYLNPLDHYIKEDLGIDHYVRYMDDFIIFPKNKQHGKEVKDKIEEYLNEKLNLRMNPKSCIYKLKEGIDFAGYVTYKDRIEPRKRNIIAAKRRFRSIPTLDIKDPFIEVKINKIKQQAASFISYMYRPTHNYSKTVTYSILRPVLYIKKIKELYDKSVDNWHTYHNSLL